MLAEREVFDWEAQVWASSEQGQLLALLHSVPRCRWFDVNPEDGWSLLHYASLTGSVDAAVALLKHGLDPNVCDGVQRTPVHYAAWRGQPRMLQVLCAAGANLRAPDYCQRTPLTLALADKVVPDVTACIRVLVANGVRLSGARKARDVSPDLWDFERGVLACRAVVVVLLGVKRRRGLVMRAVDRWVVLEVARACWATRASNEWRLK